MDIYGYYIQEYTDTTIYKEGQVYSRDILFYQTLKDGLRFNNERTFDSRVYEIVILDGVNYDPSRCWNHTNMFKIVHILSFNEVLSLINDGSWNTGFLNTGDYNSGNHNHGDSNSGDKNYGSCNTGDDNIGSFNVGCHNSGNCNTGDYNSGDCNSGDFNFGNRSSGIFNTDKNPKIMMFDKPSNWTMDDWRNSKAYEELVYRMPKQEAHRQSWWDKLPQERRETIMDMPNFDKEKFFYCTGIKV